MHFLGDYIKESECQKNIDVNPTKTNRPDFSSSQGLTSLLSKAGFSSIDIQEESKVFYYKNKDEWWHEQSNNASRGFFERIKSNHPELFDDFKTAAYEEVEGLCNSIADDS